MKGGPRDLAQASAFYDALTGGRVLLAFQPVVHGGDPAVCFYEEALLRIAAGSADSPVQLPGPIIAVLERLGLMRHLDRCVASTVIGLLAEEPTLRLGCNVSAQSMVADAWWQPVFDTLASRPDVAARLVVEITESAMFTDVPVALGFVGRLQALGCRVALDDFGAGYSTLAFAVQARPDIIKVDRSYLRRATADPAGPSGLEAMLRLCASLAPEVVLEGVESDADAALAQACAAQWLQGRHIAWPRLQPPWRDRPAAVIEGWLAVPAWPAAGMVSALRH